MTDENATTKISGVLDGDSSISHGPSEEVNIPNDDVPAEQEIPNQGDREEKGLDEDQLMDLELEAEGSSGDAEDQVIAFEDVETAYTVYFDVAGNEEAIESFKAALYRAGLDSYFFFSRIITRVHAEHLCAELSGHDMLPGKLRDVDEDDVQRLLAHNPNIFITDSDE